MLAEFALVVVGLGLLLLGGRGFVTGCSRLAASLRVSELAVGLTVAAFGTSAPELAVNILAAAEGNASLAFGNVVGSNLANTTLVLGVCAMTRTLRIESNLVSREIPIMLAATAVTGLLGLDWGRRAPGVYSMADGLVLLTLFGGFLYYSILRILEGRRSDPVTRHATEQISAGLQGRIGLAALLAVGGLGILVVGAEVTVTHAVHLAEALDVSRAVIGLTVVALGTSLPELATSWVAARQGHASLAVGNVVGSNVFNLLFILGTTATIRPVEVPTAWGLTDLGVLVAFSLVLALLSRGKPPRVRRGHGLVLVLGYLGYMTLRVMT